MLPVVVFPDAELWVTDALRDLLEDREADVFVSNRVPNPRRPRMVIVRSDGGPRLDVARQIARVGVRVWDESPQSALDLARLVGALLCSAPDGANVSKVSQTLGPTRIEDDSKQDLIYMTFELTLKGSTLV